MEIDPTANRGAARVDPRTIEGHRVQREAARETEARPRVLLVDDEPMVRRGISRCLDRMGYEVTAVESASAALAAVKEAWYDAILTDFQMPGMNGKELVERLLENDPALRSRIVVTSGDPNADSVTRLVARVGCRALAKPFELSDLGATIRSCVQGCKSDR